MLKQIVILIFILVIFSCAKRDPFYDACVKFEPIQLQVGDTIRFINCGEYEPIIGTFYKTSLSVKLASTYGTIVYFSQNEAIGVVKDTGLYNFSILEYAPKTKVEKIKRIGSFEVVL